MSGEFKGYLIEVLEAIEDIESVTEGLSFEEFAKNAVAVRTVARDFAHISGTSKHMLSGGGGRSGQLLFLQRLGFRGRGFPDFNHVKADVLWDVIKSDLPVLKARIEDFLDDFGSE